MLNGSRHQLLSRWAQLIADRPRAVLGVAGLWAAVSIAVTLFGIPWLGISALQFQSNRNDLISPELAWNQRFIHWNQNFAGTRNLTVVVDPFAASAGQSDDKLQTDRHLRAKAMVQQLGVQLQKLPAIKNIFWSYRITSAKAIRTTKMHAFVEQLGKLEQSGSILESTSIQQWLGKQMVQGMRTSPVEPKVLGGGKNELRPRFNAPSVGGGRRDAYPTKEGAGGKPRQDVGASVREAARLLDAVDMSLREPNNPRGHLVDFLTHLENQYLTSDNGRLYFLRLTPRITGDSLNEMGDAIASIRQVINQVKSQFPQMDAGLTGIEVVEADETQAAMHDSMIASMLAVVLIGSLLIAAFHSWRSPLLAIITLLFAIACSFGYLTVAIGHLQVISVVFTAILMGLGIDYAIHLITRYELVRHDYADDLGGFTLALQDTLTTMGPGIITGALTTAVAFATTLFTDFKGVAEMGHIAAAGIMICIVLMFSVFPALLRIYKPYHRHVPQMRQRHVHFFKVQWLLPFTQHPKITLVTAAMITGVSLFATSKMSFDYDLMALMPEKIDSVLWQQRVTEQGGQAVWYGTCVADDLEQAQRWAQQLRQQSTIDPSLGGVGLLWPHDEVAKLALLKKTRLSLGPALDQVLGSVGRHVIAKADRPGRPKTGETPVLPEVFGQNLGQKQNLLGQFDADNVPSLLAQLTAIGNLLKYTPPGLLLPEDQQAMDRALSKTIKTLTDLPPAQRQQRVAKLNQQYLKARKQLAQLIDQACDPTPMGMDDMPALFKRQYVGSDGRLALEVYPDFKQYNQRHGLAISSPLDPGYMSNFIADLRQVDAQATGVIVQVYESGSLIKRSYQLAGLWALIAVVLLLWLDFHTLGRALLCLVPVAIGFAATFGLMQGLGMQINPANIIVLPLMFGIGVDAGVHILHRYQQDKITQPLGLSAGTGKGITITSLTTMIGFGVLMIGRHRGIQSLGFVLFAGVGLTLLACLIVMPCLLKVGQAKRREEA